MRGVCAAQHTWALVGACEGGERAGGAHLSAHFAKLGSRRSKGLALADNRSLEHDNLRGPLVQLGMRLSNLSLSERDVPDAGKALRAPGFGFTAAVASRGLGPRRLGLVHGQKKSTVSSRGRSRSVLGAYCLLLPLFFSDRHAWVALKEGGCHARPFFW